ncbi:MAG: class A beta-lactamase-related serine hydrolase [Arthrobacter sp.]|nr:class A beta-lactamase-related serine hydrolase [Arthrobacter sp.]
MKEHTPRQGPRPIKERRSRRARRRVLLGACTAVLAVALAATVYTSAEARSAAGRPTTSSTTASTAAAPAPTSTAAVAPAPTATLAPTATPAATPAAAPTPAPAAGGVGPALDAELNAIIDANGGYQIGVSLIDLADGTVHDYGVQQPFEAASTAKVLAAAAFYHLVESGGASLNEPMGAWTAGFQLKEMIQDSDNDSWSLIMDAVGHQQLSDYAASIGVNYSPESNTLTPAEMARVMAALYSGKLLDKDDTAELLSYMQNTNYESLIPEAAPADVEVYHKYGLLDGELHDAGILTKNGSAYALVIYTKGDSDGDIPQRTDVIHQLTRAVTDAVF